MTNEEFCRLHSAYNGEKLTDVRQLVSETFNGEELKEFIEFCIDQSKLNQPTVISAVCGHFGDRIFNEDNNTEWCCDCKSYIQKQTY